MTQVKSALESARRLAEAGVPLFIAPPIKSGKVGFKLPKGWERTEPDPSIVDEWEPGWALCAVTGHVVDVIDIDPRNGGSYDALKQALGGDLPRTYGRAQTPSGGEHYLIASLGVRKVPDIVQGVDIQAGNLEGVGRGFIFLAPTERVSKTDGKLRPYYWDVDPDIGALLLDTDDSGRALKDLIGQRQIASPAQLFGYEGPSYDELDDALQKESDEHVNGQLLAWIARFEEAQGWEEGVRDGSGRGWEALTYQFAWALAKMASCPWTSLSPEQAEEAFHNILPAEMAEAVPGRWYEGIAAKASEDVVSTPPWVVRGSPSDDFGEAAAAWPEIPERFNEADLASWTAHKGLGGDWRWAMKSLGWLHWNGRVWEPFPEEMVIEAIRRTFLRLATRVVATGDPDMIKLATGLLNKSKISNIAALIRGILSVPAEAFDHHPDLLNVGNGVVDLATGDLLPHDRKYLMTKITNTAYEPGATHPDWDQVLKALDPDVMDWMQIRFGQAATGWPTSDDVLPVGVGSGSNGKSTLLAGIFKALGDHATMVPDRLLQPNAGDQPTELMTLWGARVAVVDETPEAGYLDTQRIKDVLGKPVLTARALYQNHVSWTPTHSLFVMTNYTPQIRETDWGVWRRLALVKFDKTFPKKDGFRQAISNGEGGRAEAALAWIIEGAARWYQLNKVIPDKPSKVELDTKAWNGTSDMVLSFRQEGYIEVDPSSYIYSGDLLEVFNKWLRSRGQPDWSAGTLAARLQNHREFPHVESAQTRDIDRISRHPDSFSELPARPKVWKGLKWGSTG